MTEGIIDILNSMMQAVVKVDTGDYPARVKDLTKQYFSQALNFTIEELSPLKIERMVYQNKKSKENNEASNPR